MRQLPHCKTYELVSDDSAIAMLEQVQSLLGTFDEEPALISLNVSVDMDTVGMADAERTIFRYRAHVTLEDDCS